MWRTELGDRTLEGAEGELFRRMAEALWYDLDAELEPGFPADDSLKNPTGIAEFDRLTVGQRYVLLSQITVGLMNPKIPVMPLTQPNEAAIAAVYSMGAQGLVDCDQYKDFRHLVRAVARQHDLTGAPAIRASLDEYAEFFEELLSLILFDHDYAMDPLVADAPPDVRDNIQEQMRIGEGYFAEVVPEPTDLGPHARLLRKFLETETIPYGPRGPIQSARRYRRL